MTAWLIGVKFCPDSKDEEEEENTEDQDEQGNLRGLIDDGDEEEEESQRSASGGGSDSEEEVKHRKKRSEFCVSIAAHRYITICYYSCISCLSVLLLQHLCLCLAHLKWKYFAKSRYCIELT